jgi:hypothetical protein
MPRLGIFHVIVQRRRRPGIADRVGVVSTERSSRPTGGFARKRAANATLQNKRLFGTGEIVNRQAVGAVSMEKSSRVRRNNVRRGAASISPHKKKQPSTAGRAGSAWTENLFECLRQKLERESCSVTLRTKTPPHIAGRVGVACKDAKAESSFKPLRRSASAEAVSVTTPPKKRAGTTVYLETAGSAWTESLFECLRGKPENESFNAMRRNKKPPHIAGPAGAASKDQRARSSSRPTRRIARNVEVNATIPKIKRKAVALIKTPVGAASTQRTA